jgi:hypothetical protein
MDANDFVQADADAKAEGSICKGGADDIVKGQQIQKNGSFLLQMQ